MTALKKADNKSVTIYVIRAKQIITALGTNDGDGHEGVTGEVQAVHTDGDAWFSRHDAGRVQGKVEEFRGFRRGGRKGAEGPSGAKEKDRAS